MKIFKICLVIISIVVAFFIINNIFFKSTKIETIKIGYSIQEAIGNSPLIVAYEKGFFEKKNLIIEMIPLKNGGEIAQALSSGSLDIGIIGMSNLLIPISKGAPVKIIAPLAQFPVDFFVRPGEIKTFKDLLGKRIASRPGGSADFVVRYVLKQEGINVNQIEFVDIDRAFRPIALMKRDIVDAAAAVSYDTTAFTESGAIIMREWKEKGYTKISSLGDAVVMNIVINTDYLKNHESIVKDFLIAYINGHEYIKTNKNEAALIIANHTTKESKGAFTYTPDDILKLWDKQKNMYQLWYEPKNLLGLFDIAKEMSIIEKIPKTEDFFDERFKEYLIYKHKQLYE